MLILLLMLQSHRYVEMFCAEGKTSRCQQNNGGCSNLCIPLMNSFTCSCPDFSRLANDNATCISGTFLADCLATRFF